MKQTWAIALIVILIIAGSIGSAYMLRSVGSVGIDTEALKQKTESQQATIDSLTEKMELLTEKQIAQDEKMVILESDNQFLKEKMTFIGEQLVNIPGVMSRFGTVRDMHAGNGFVTFEIDVKEWLAGEEGMTYLIEKRNMTIEDAADEMKKGHLVIDMPDESVIYKLDKSALINMLDGSQLYEADLKTLIDKVSQLKDTEENPMFHFYVVDGVIIEVDEKYIP